MCSDCVRKWCWRFVAPFVSKVRVQGPPGDFTGVTEGRRGGGPQLNEEQFNFTPKNELFKSYGEGIDRGQLLWRLVSLSLLHLIDEMIMKLKAEPQKSSQTGYLERNQRSTA